MPVFGYDGELESTKLRGVDHDGPQRRVGRRQRQPGQLTQRGVQQVGVADTREDIGRASARTCTRVAAPLKRDELLLLGAREHRAGQVRICLLYTSPSPRDGL